MDSSPYPVEEGEQHVPTPEALNSGKRKIPDASGATSSKPTKDKKILGTRADVWSHFTRFKDNRDRCSCNYCQRELACPTKSGTSSMKNHIKICKEYTAWREGEAKAQHGITEEGKLRIAKVPEHVFREATNEMVVLGELPLSWVDSLAWKHFCSKVNLYKPHTRRTLTKDIVKMFLKKKAALKQLFSANKQRVSLTTDIWVAQPTGCSYMVITAHFIDQNWRLKKLIIGFKHIIDHKGQTICDTLLECLADWGIERVFCITVDNATANTTALDKFQTSFSSVSSDSLVLNGEFMHMRCAGHILNLIVQDGLAQVDANVSAIRNAVSYVRSGTNRQRSFELRVDSGKLSRGSLPLDVKTRWNSTYLMLIRALKYKEAFQRMQAEDKLYTDYFQDTEAKRVGPPQMSDWDAVDRLVRFLVIFYNSTLTVSSSNTLNSHKCYGEIVTIETNLVSLSCSSDNELKTKAQEMLLKFDKYWDGMRKINKMVIVATVFDPTKKMQFPKLCFDELYGKDSRESRELFESVMELLKTMYNEYSLRHGSTSLGQSSHSSHTTHSQSSQGTQESDMMEPAELADDLGYNRIEKRYKEMLNEIGIEETRDELERYLTESVENPKLLPGVEYDVLSWWKLNSGKFPILSNIAKDVFAMQVSSVASESAFSTSGRIVDSYRSCLSHFTIEVLMCIDQWMKQDLRYESKVLSIAQILADLDFDDNLEKECATPLMLGD